MKDLRRVEVPEDGGDGGVEATSRRKWIARGCFLVLFLGLAVQWLVTPVVLQVTQSLERGVYVRGFGPVGEGSVVLTPMPASIGPLLEAHGKASTGYLLKPVFAVGPVAVDTTGERSLVDGLSGGLMEQVSSKGIAYPVHRTVEPLGRSEVWLESAGGTSVDSRAFGPVDAAGLRGPYRLLWSWEPG